MQKADERWRAAWLKRTHPVGKAIVITGHVGIGITTYDVYERTADGLNMALQALRNAETCDRVNSQHSSFIHYSLWIAPWQDSRLALLPKWRILEGETGPNGTYVRTIYVPVARGAVSSKIFLGDFTEIGRRADVWTPNTDS